MLCQVAGLLSPNILAVRRVNLGPCKLHSQAVYTCVLHAVLPGVWQLANCTSIVLPLLLRAAVKLI